jgi:hypothetical protein
VSPSILPAATCSSVPSMNAQPLHTQTQQSAPFAPTFSRRYACDRCRGHKLRCNRDLMTSTNTPCQRCRKARAKCTIGSSLRVDTARERPKDLPRERGMPSPTTSTIAPTIISRYSYSPLIRPTINRCQPKPEHSSKRELKTKPEPAQLHPNHPTTIMGIRHQ